MSTNYGLLGITPQDRRQAGYQGLMNLGGALLQGSATSTQPGGFIRALGAAGPAFTQAYEGNINKALARNMQGLKLQTAQRAADWRKAIGANDMQNARLIDPVATASFMKDQYLPVDPSQDLYRIGGGGGPPPSVPGTSPVPPFLVQEAQQQQTPVNPAATGVMGVTPQMRLPPQPLTGSPDISPSVPRHMGGSPASQGASATTSSIPGMTLVRKATPEWTQVELPNGQIVLQSRDGQIKEMPGQPDPTKEYSRTGLTQKGVDRRHKEWRAAVKPQIEQTEATQIGMDKVLSALDQKNGTADIAAITAFIKMIDEGVVRGEEVRLQREAQSLKNYAGTIIQQWKEGDILSDTVRGRMANMARLIQNSVMQTTARSLADTKSIVDRTEGLDWSMVVPQYSRVYEPFLVDLMMNDSGSPARKAPPISHTEMGGALTPGKTYQWVGGKLVLVQ